MLIPAHLLRAGCRAVLMVLLAATPVLADPLVISVVDAEAAADPSTGEPMVLFRMSEASASAFGELTGTNIGRRLELRIDGEAINAPVIREAISRGEGVISGLPVGIDPAGMAARLVAGDSVVEVEIIDE